MSYAVHEIFESIQGEGFHQGRPAAFIRFAGCNLWSGLERDRADAICQFCDTEFVGAGEPDGGKFSNAQALAARVADTWARGAPNDASRFVILTGGEPLLQVNTALIGALHDEGFEIAVETNGTIRVPPGVDWICVSPKAGAPLVQTTGDELKLVFPQPGAPPERYAGLQFRHFFLQPMDGPDAERNTDQAIAYCRTHPAWEVSVQLHKYLGLR